jgi:drug/metabolite transporter (DMT)-like permease
MDPPLRSASVPAHAAPAGASAWMAPLAFGLMALIWGLTWLPMKVAALDVPPIFLAACRFVLAGMGFFVWCRLAGKPLATRQKRRLVASALLITTGCYGPLFWGVAHAPSGLSAIVNLALLPVFVILIGAAYREERITARRLAAIALGMVGLVALFSGRSAGPADGGLVAWGIVGVLAGTLSYAWGAIISRPLVREIAPIALAFWQTLIGGLALVPISLAVEGWRPGQLAALGGGPPLLGLAFLVLGGSLTAFSIYLWLVRDWGAFRAGLYSFVSPIIAVLVGVVWASEPFGPAEALGMLILLGATCLAVGGRPPA